MCVCEAEWGDTAVVSVTIQCPVFFVCCVLKCRVSMCWAQERMLGSTMTAAGHDEEVTRGSMEFSTSYTGIEDVRHDPVAYELRGIPSEYRCACCAA